MAVQVEVGMVAEMADATAVIDDYSRHTNPLVAKADVEVEVAFFLLLSNQQQMR